MNFLNLLFLLIALVILIIIWLMVSVNSARNRQQEIERQREREQGRVVAINQHSNEWSFAIIQDLLAKSITIGMTTDMVRLSWGEPTSIEIKEATAHGQKIRWVYGLPRHGAKYLWFVNEKLTKVQG